MSEPVPHLSARTTSTGVGLLTACVAFLICALQGDSAGRCVVKAMLCGLFCGLMVSTFAAIWKKMVDGLPDDR
ncbi:MAG: hypothetical protein NXI04_20250 [Planctomycetaceae bacterium]|nr:hypothetical protein [Planctomycetaceae bacterium]